MKVVKKALAAAVLAIACGSAMASSVNGFVNVTTGTNKNINTIFSPDTDPSVLMDPAYWELRVGAQDYSTTFTLIDTDTEGFTVDYDLYEDADSTAGAFTLGSFVAHWSFTDAAGIGGSISKLLLANTQYVLKMTTNGATSSTTNVSAVPLPAAALLFGTALLGMGVFRRRKQVAAV